MQKLRTILISVLIIVALFTSIYFPYKWKQLSNDFLNQTNQYGELLKQINDLQKEVGELREGEEEVKKLPDENLEIDEINKTIGLKCSEENPPRIYPGKFGNLLNLCGEKTSFQAHKFEKENIILFQTSRWDEKKSKHYYTLKTISTIYPYKVKILINDENLNLGVRWDSNYNNLYFKEIIASGPGDYYRLFIFSPETQEFIVVENIYHGYSGPHSLFLYSSVSKSKFVAEERNRESHTGEVLLSDDNDIEIIINEKIFTKKEVEEGKADFEKDIFDYSFLPIEFREKDDSEKIKEMYSRFFPKKVPYFKYDYYKDQKEIEDLIENPVGLFDFEKNEFIKF